MLTQTNYYACFGLLLMLLVSVLDAQQEAEASDPLEPSTTAKILLSRGYLAKDHYVSVQGGKAKLNLVQANNPIINNGLGGLPDRPPLLFVHGLNQDSTSWIYINDGVAPRDLSCYNISQLSYQELRRIVTKRPGFQSLVFTALNFGYEVWLLNRRSSVDSQRANGLGKGAIDLATPQKYTEYWNYTLTDQGLYDVPETMEYVLLKTKRQKLSLVAFSAGSTVTLMALTDRPELADIVDKAVFFAPPFDFGFGYLGPVFDDLFVALLPIISRLKIAFPDVTPPKLSIPIDIYTGIACADPLLKPFLCSPLFDLALGPGTIQLRTEYFNLENRWFSSSGALEYAQYVQSIEKGRMHRFDYMNRRQNLIAYNQIDAPIYNLGRIRLPTMSFYVGETDRLASVANFNLTKQRLPPGSYKQTIIGGNGIQFNHQGPHAHKDNTDFAILPALIDLATP